MIELKDIKQAIQEIDYTDVNLEIAWQIELIIKLREKFGSIYKIIPEKTISKKEKDIKKEIDIAIYEKTTPKIAIELKMPRNGAYPRRMSQAICDVAFLESLIANHDFQKGYFIFLTDDSGFWAGKNNGDNLSVYSYFRNYEKLQGKVSFPEFVHINEAVEISGCYRINWEEINEKWKYFIIEINK